MDDYIYVLEIKNYLYIERGSRHSLIAPAMEILGNDSILSSSPKISGDWKFFQAISSYA